jgi:ribonuclease Z
MINVTLIGTGGMIPTPNRFLSSCLIEYNGKSVLIDCGEGTQISLSKGKISMNKIDAILITHCHADHVTGLPGLLLTVGNSMRTEPVYIIVPKGFANIINSLLIVCGFLPYEVRIVEISENKQQQFEFIGLNITSFPLRHHISCLGYSFELMLKPRFLPEKAEKLNIPVNLWKILHNGKSVTHENSMYTPDMVLGKSRKPIKISFATDTRPVKSINEAVANSDLFICEGMYGDDELYDNAVEKKHMLFSEAALIAKDSNVKELWLTHYSPSLVNPEQFLEQAKKIFPNTVAGYDLMTKKIIPESEEE